MILNLYFLAINDYRGHLVRRNELLSIRFYIITPEVNLLGLLRRLIVHLIGFVSNVPHNTAIVLINESAILLDLLSFLFSCPLPFLLHLHHGNQLSDFFFAQVLWPVLSPFISKEGELYFHPTQLRCFNH